MFLKKIKTNFLLLLILSVFIPIKANAYSDYILAGGENIGILLKSNYIMVVGTYETEGIDTAKKAGLNIGDKIIKVGNKPVSSIEEMISSINNTGINNNIDITYLRDNKEYSTSLTLIKDVDGVYKTGLYVKDSISGIGTLTFIDPNTKLYGALGHEIIEKSTGQKLEIKDGYIYDSTVTNITPSDDGHPGEKNARYDTTKVYGNVRENTSAGVFGTINNIPEKKLYKVAKVEEVELGDAKILTVISNKLVEEFNINILKINKSQNTTKNILFEINDSNLLSKTGGIVQGMSGSPIIQNGNIVGAVTHVVVDDPTKGYGIFITTMLEEAEN